uniref:Uncharacterized protein n=1 Tax=Candidatus Kentrum sp. FW TaxID=2126338 RepID=A0A450TKE6_9GAMM|nr:MAG: hypothetical protein BECKFW1821C_GA0114237_101341 [Candidatus Kentron sp. FW]
MISGVVGSPKTRDQVISDLGRISGNMRITSMIIMLATIINVALTFVVMYGAMYRVSVLGLYGGELIRMVEPVVMFTVFVVVAAFLFVFLKKRGDAYFEELSDELHASGASEPNRDEFSLSARIVMRSYSNYASLPLIPGRFGPGIIAGLNILLSLLILPFLVAIFS